MQKIGCGHFIIWEIQLYTRFCIEHLSFSERFIFYFFKTVRVNIIKIVSKNSWDTKLRFYKEAFWTCRKVSQLFCRFTILAWEHASVWTASWSEHGEILFPPPTWSQGWVARLQHKDDTAQIWVYQILCSQFNNVVCTYILFCIHLVCAQLCINLAVSKKCFVILYFYRLMLKTYTFTRVC